MAIDSDLVTLADEISKAAAKVNAAGATPSRSFYASADGWVCFGNPNQSGEVSAMQRMGGRLYASATATADATALNAIQSAAVTAKQAADIAEAQSDYDFAAAALKQAAKK